MTNARRLLSRLTTSLLWGLAILVIVGAVNLVGIRIAGDVSGWSRWLQTHSLYFLGWRLCLYGGTAYGWWWMRNRVLRREGVEESRTRFRRAEVAAALAVLALETAVFVQSLQE
jgi:hypothetical protein